MFTKQCGSDHMKKTNLTQITLILFQLEIFLPKKLNDPGSGPLFQGKFLRVGMTGGSNVPYTPRYAQISPPPPNSRTRALICEYHTPVLAAEPDPRLFKSSKANSSFVDFGTETKSLWRRLISAASGVKVLFFCRSLLML